MGDEWWTKKLDDDVVVTRKEARSLSKDESSRIAAAYMKMRENKHGKPGTSEYFRLAVIHGGFPGLSRAEYPEHCCHGKEAFGAWHRPYLLDFERSMRRADIALGNDGNIGLPYWDWSHVKVKGQVLPGFVRSELMKEFEPDFFPPGCSSSFLSGFKMSRTNPDSQIEAQITKLGKAASGAMNVTTHCQAVCTKWQDSFANIESPHNMIHGVVGGIMAAFQSSFHPVFWMHHNNIDRFYEGYLSANPDSATEFENFQKTAKTKGQAGFPDGPWGPYLPFKHHKTGETFHARDCFGGTSALGYKFDDVPEPPPLNMREPPFLAVFRDIDIHKLSQCRMLYIFVHDKLKPWAPPKDTSPETLNKHGGFAGQNFIFFAGSQHCRNCMDRDPYHVLVDVTDAMRKDKIAPKNCEIKVMVRNLEDETVVDISETPIPPPELKGPRVHTLEDESPESERLVREFLNHRPCVRGADDKSGESGMKAFRGQTITWAIKKESIPSGLKLNDAIEDLEKAFKAWEEPSGLKFEKVEGGSSRLLMQWSNNALDFEGTFDGPGKKLGHGDANGIVFDGSERWEAGSGKHPHRHRYNEAESFFNPFFRLYTVALHEIGHVLGLDHDAEAGDIMYPCYDEKVNTLSENDKKRVAQVIKENQCQCC